MAEGTQQKRSTDGSAYGRSPQHPDFELTQVGPGTPCGELLRRYWQPVGVSSKVTDRPQYVRILGEDLIIFRDKKGRPGLLYARCMHRGTTLFYGKVSEEGIACCYHGWLFDVEGRCLRQPCEPDGGRNLDVARQPWYPVEERYGLAFAYMGPLEKKPVLPRYDVLENPGPDEELRASIGAFGATGDNSLEVAPYSWLHMNDNVMDPFHVQVLHSTFSTVQFVPQFALMPKVEFFTTENGVCYSAKRKLDDGREYDRISSFIMPNVMCVPNPINIEEVRPNRMSWSLAIDDSHFTMATASRVPKSTPREFSGVRFNGKLWGEMTIEERQATPGDYEAQAGQGPISLHSEEHLASSDRGIIMQRRLLKSQIKIVAEGGDPVGVVFDPDKALVKVRSGNFYNAPQPA
ncbi:MAG TPA: Rieske 2Fe-2S domain-containing protein [Verrucomicrobiae bacterium]|nr:Rieske 2Fe-2S domain-containing protein [Verrucomicrobiae bacterium]